MVTRLLNSWLGKRVALLLITVAVVCGVVTYGYTQFLVNPGANPQAISFPSGFYLVFGQTAVVASGATTSAPFPTGTCGHNLFFGTGAAIVSATSAITDSSVTIAGTSMSNPGIGMVLAWGTGSAATNTGLSYAYLCN